MSEIDLALRHLARNFGHLGGPPVLGGQSHEEVAANGVYILARAIARKEAREVAAEVYEARARFDPPPSEPNASGVAETVVITSRQKARPKIMLDQDDEDDARDAVMDIAENIQKLRQAGPTAERPTAEEVEAIIRVEFEKHIRLVVKNPNDECEDQTWMVKPASEEKFITEAAAAMLRKLGGVP